jgi:RNA-binding protein
MQPLPNSELRKYKARAQLLEPMFKVGKAGLSDGFVKSVSDALALHDLVKVKFVELKEQKKALAPVLAERTASHLIMRVGNVAVLCRPKPAAPTAGIPPIS